MVSKEPDHLLTGQNNGKSTLADKLPGTMTVRSVLLNRDSPDIESRLKRRRNRTHQVRFKDLEDGSSSSGNSGTGENNSHQRPAKDCDSPHPFRKHNSRSVQPWTDRERPLSAGLPGQTSVVGAVRGDMASTIEVVAAFLARAPPHPLTPGPTRRCWAPPQTNSLTLPMTRKPSTSISTAIQTSPCLKKTQTLSSTHTRSHSLGDSVGVDGDDEHDSQDEYVTHNDVSFSGSKDPNRGSGAREQAGKESRSKSTRTELKSAVTVLKISKHSFSSSALHNAEPCQCSSVPCRDGSKRQGSSTPSVVRRRKRLSRTTSDPGKEVHYCTTPTQTEGPGPSPLTSNAKLCTTQVQTESPSPPPISQYCTTQSQTEIQPQSSTLTDENCTSQTKSIRSSILPPNSEQCTMQVQTDSPTRLSPDHKPCTTQTQTSSPDASPTVTTSPTSPISDQPQTQTVVPLPETEDPPSTQIASVPYCPSPPPEARPKAPPEASPEARPEAPPEASPEARPEASPEASPKLTPEHCSKPPSLSPTKQACTTQPPPLASSLSPSTVTQPSIPYYTVVSPSATPSSVVVSSTPSPVAAPCTTSNCPSPSSKIASVPSATCSTLSTIVTTSADSITHATRAPDIPQSPDEIASSSTSLMNSAPCTFVTQTAMSCTSISYYTTTHPVVPHVPHINPTAPTYATVIQTVSHCNYPCQVPQNVSSTMTGLTPYSSPVPKIKSCTSPIPLVKTLVSTLPNAKSSATPTKVVPLYSSTFRPAPPYTPPSQAPHSAQDKRGIRLPPPPPPPPPYTPRKQGTDPPGPTFRTPILRSESKTSEKCKEKEKGDITKCTQSPKRCERTNSLKHRAQTPPVAVMKGERPSSTSSPAKACFKPSCLSSAQAHLGVLHKMLCSGANTRPHTPSNQHMLPPNLQGCPRARRCSAPGEQPIAGPLTATQADTLRQVQEILGGLVSGARCKLDPARVTEKLLGPNGPLHDIKSLQSHLHSLEGVLETSQNTIKVLLDVIQDLEKKEAERDGHLYRTGQDIENCGTCRDCACIIYSVEHDFRLQEGQVVRTWKVGDPPEDRPQTPTLTPTPSTPSQQDSPEPVRPPAANKKNRKKCFWFL